MDGNEHQHERQEVARDQERLLRLARLYSAGPVESPVARIARDSIGIGFAATPAIEYALSASADEAAAAGEDAREWRARQAAWVNVGPCDPDLPHADAPDRFAQAMANLRDVGLWPWADGGDTDDALYAQVLAPVRALLRDPTVAPARIGQETVRTLYPALRSAGSRAYHTHGRGVVLVDLRPAAEATVSYIPLTLLAASDNILPPYIAVEVMIEAYDPARAVLRRRPHHAPVHGLPPRSHPRRTPTRRAPHRLRSIASACAGRAMVTVRGIHKERQRESTRAKAGAHTTPMPLGPDPAILSFRGLAKRGPMDADETDAPETLLSLRDAAAALGLRPATVKQYILRGQLAAVRLPQGHATRLFVAPAEIARYRRASLGAQGWTTRRARVAEGLPVADASHWRSRREPGVTRYHRRATAAFRRHA